MRYGDGDRAPVVFQGHGVGIVAVLYFQQDEMFLGAVRRILKGDFPGDVQHVSRFHGVAAVVIHGEVPHFRGLRHGVHPDMQRRAAGLDAMPPVGIVQRGLPQPRVGHVHMGDGDVHVLIVVVIAGNKEEIAHAREGIRRRHRDGDKARPAGRVVDNVHAGGGRAVLPQALDTVRRRAAVGGHGVFERDGGNDVAFPLTAEQDARAVIAIAVAAGRMVRLVPPGAIILIDPFGRQRRRDVTRLKLAHHDVKAHTGHGDVVFRRHIRIGAAAVGIGGVRPVAAVLDAHGGGVHGVDALCARRDGHIHTERAVMRRQIGVAHAKHMVVRRRAGTGMDARAVRSGKGAENRRKIHGIGHFVHAKGNAVERGQMLPGKKDVVRLGAVRVIVEGGLKMDGDGFAGHHAGARRRCGSGAAGGLPGHIGHGVHHHIQRTVHARFRA